MLFRAEDGHLLLTVQLFEEENDLLVQIVDNELVFSVDPWDVEFKGRQLIVRGGPRDIFVRMKFEPAESRITIDRAHIWRNGIELEIHPDRVVFLPNQNVVSEGTTVNSFAGLSTGDIPDGVGGFVHMGTMRRPFNADTPTEPAVRKLVRK